MENKRFLQSDKVCLRPFEDGDVQHLSAWFNDPEVTHFMFTGQKPTTEKQVKKIMDHDIEHGRTSTAPQSIKTIVEQEVKALTNTIFMVCNVSTEELIGLVGLYEIHQIARKAEMRIIIGNKNYWGKGYGTEITEIINFYGFDRLNLHRIYLGVTHENKGGIRAYEKAGYVHEGVLKEDIYRNSRYYDSVRMGILRNDYYEKFYENHKTRFNVKQNT